MTSISLHTQTFAYRLFGAKREFTNDSQAADPTRDFGVVENFQPLKIGQLKKVFSKAHTIEPTTPDAALSLMNKKVTPGQRLYVIVRQPDPYPNSARYV